jgi:hypothetical protein
MPGLGAQGEPFAAKIADLGGNVLKMALLLPRHLQ